MISLFGSNSIFRFFRFNGTKWLADRFIKVGNIIFKPLLFKTLNFVRNKNKPDSTTLTSIEFSTKWKELIEFTESDNNMVKRINIFFTIISIILIVYSVWFFFFFLTYHIIFKILLFLSITSLVLFLIRGEVKYYTPLNKISFEKCKELFPELFTDEPKK